MLLSPIQYLHFRRLCHRSMEIYPAQKSRHCLYRQCFNSCSIPMNMAVGILLKWDPTGIHYRCFSWYFPQLLELRLLKRHIGDRLRSVRFRSSCLQNIWKVYRKANVARSFLIETAKKNSQQQLFSRIRFARLSSI